MARYKPAHADLPETFVLRTLFRLLRFGNHIRRELAIALGLAVTLSVSFAIYRSMSPEAEPEGLKVERVALTNENVLSWINTAHKLADRRSKGNFRIPDSTLPGFIEWVKKKPTTVAQNLDGMAIEEFLGIAVSLDTSRNCLRKLVEYDIRIQEEDELLEASSDPDIQIPVTPPPTLKDNESADLKVYEYHLNTVEMVLAELIPGIRLPVPAWEEEASGASAVDNGEASPSDPASRVKWRVVNRSRYGPKVIKIR